MFEAESAPPLQRDDVIDTMLGNFPDRDAFS